MILVNVKSDSDKGFTLIEAMISLVVLLVGILGVMAMQYYAITGNTSSREMRVATNLTLDSIELAKSTPYASLVGDTDVPFVAEDITMTAGITTFARKWWVVSDCVALTTTALANACTTDPCGAAIVAACEANGDPDSAEVVAVSAIRTRTCWQDKNNCFHSVTIDSLRWDENVTP